MLSISVHSQFSLLVNEFVCSTFVVCLKHLLHFDFLRYHLLKLLPEFKNSTEASYLL